MMIDVVQYIAIPFVSGLIGGAVGGRIFFRPRRGKIHYDCNSCGHGFGYHEGGNRCFKEVFDGTCKCRKYVGDRPPPSYEELTS